MKLNCSRLFSEYLRDKLKPTASTDAKKLDLLIADLDSEKFDLRRNAEQEIAAMDELAESALRKAIEQNSPLDLATRIKQLIQRIERLLLAPERLQMARGIEAVERIGGNEARDLLKQRADGDPARQTQDAKSAMLRMR